MQTCTEKELTVMMKSYHSALHLLKNQQTSEGTAMLLSILDGQLIDDADLRNLKYSTLLSLAEVKLVQGYLLLALSYYYSALEVLTSGYRQPGEQQEGGSYFCLLLKMCKLTEKLGIVEINIYLLKRALRVCPTLWREKVLARLKELYEKTNNKDALRDMDNFMWDLGKLEALLSRSQMRYTNMANPIEYAYTKYIGNKAVIMERVRLTINLNQKSEQTLRFTLWYLLLTDIYVMLKCQLPRNFSKKKYPKGKFEENYEWTYFIDNFNAGLTKMYLKFIYKYPESTTNNEERNNNNPERDYKVDYSNYNYPYYIDGPTEKPNPIEQYPVNYYPRMFEYGDRINALSLCLLSSYKKKAKRTQYDIKPQASATKKQGGKSSVYYSMWYYLREKLVAWKIKRNLFEGLKGVSNECYEKVFGRFFNFVEETMYNNIEGGNDAVENSVSNSKKTLKAVKTEIISAGNELNQRMKSCFQFESSEPVCFGNVFYLLEHIFNWIFTYKNSIKRVIDNENICSLLMKSFGKAVEQSKDYFDTLLSYMNDESNEVLERIIERIKYLTMKPYKNKAFRKHEEYKASILTNIIKEKFKISLSKAQYFFFNAPKDIYNFPVISKRCMLLTKFYCLRNSASMSYKSLYRYLYLNFACDKNENYGYKLAFEIDTAISEITRAVQVKNTELYKEYNSYKLLKFQYKIAQTYGYNLLGYYLSVLISYNPIITAYSAYVYLSCFINYMQLFEKYLYFRDNQKPPDVRQFSIKSIGQISESIKLKTVMNTMQTYLFISPNSLIISQIKFEILATSLFNFIRLFMLLQDDDSQLCLRMVFFLTTVTLKSMNLEYKQIMLPTIVVVYNEFLQSRRIKDDTAEKELRNRFYNNILARHIADINWALWTSIYYKESCEIGIKQGAISVLTNYYYNKEKEFTAKRLTDAVGYFLFLSCRRKLYFTIGDVKPKLYKEIFRKCYKIYTKYNAVYNSACEGCYRAEYNFIYFLQGTMHSNITYFKYKIITQRRACESCPYDLRLSEILLTLGMFFYAYANFEEQNAGLDYKYYLKYLLRNLCNEEAWENIIRIKCQKVFSYFYSIVTLGSISENGFLQTLRLLKLALYNKYLANMHNILHIMEASLTTLKLRERQYRSQIKKLECYGSDQLYLKKYWDGVKYFIKKSQSDIPEEYVCRYLFVAEYMTKHILHELQVELSTKAEPGKSYENIIEVILRSSRTVTFILSHFKYLINHFKTSTKYKTGHMYYEIVIEGYVFLGYYFQNIFYIAIYRFLTISGEEIEDDLQTISEKEKVIYAILYYLYYLFAFMANGDFLTDNELYRLNSERMMVKDEVVEVDYKEWMEYKYKINIVIIENKLQKRYVIELDDSDESYDRKQDGVEKGDLRDREDYFREKYEELGYREEDLGDRDEKPGEIEEQPIEVEDEEVYQQDKIKATAASNEYECRIHINIFKYFNERFRKAVTISNSDNEVKMKMIKGFLEKTNFRLFLLRFANILNEIIRVFVILAQSKLKLKRGKLRRSQIKAVFASANWAMFYECNVTEAKNIVKEIFGLKINITRTVFSTLLYRSSFESNYHLSRVYNSALVKYIEFISALKNIITLFKDDSNNLAWLAKKLLKIRNAPYQSKLKYDKEIKECGNKEISKTDCVLQLLFCEAISAYIDLMEGMSQYIPLYFKDEKNLLYFKNYIKRSNIQNEVSKKFSLFIEQYEQKYYRKIKMKRDKKAILTTDDPQKPDYIQKYCKYIVSPINNVEGKSNSDSGNYSSHNDIINDKMDYKYYSDHPKVKKREIRYRKRLKNSVYGEY